MRSYSRVVFFFCLIWAASVAFAQDEAPAAPSSSEPTSAQAPIPAITPAAPPVPVKADALELYRQGRSLEAAGKMADARAKYKTAVSICDQELAGDPSRMDAYAVKCWCLFRLELYQEVLDVGKTGLKIKYDPRLSETMGEAYYHLGNLDLALKNLQRYIETVGEYGDRVSTAYFYMAETYLRLKKYDHADIAYSLAVRREPSMARWWYRYGQTVEALKDYKRAADLYSRALRLSPEMKDAAEGLERVRAQVGP